MMTQRRPVSRLGWMTVALALLVSATAQATPAPESARDWIARMNSALATRNYDGVFVHQVAGRREVLRIIHRLRDGRMSERLVSTDGSGREFVRNGTEWVAYFPDKRVAMVETRFRSFGFITALNGLNPESDRYYAINNLGTQRVQGRLTQVISVEPRDALRFGYRFWLDQQDAIPVKTQLVNRAGEVIEEISFISLSLPATIGDELLKPDVDTTGFRWLRRDPSTHAPAVKVVFTPRLDLLPAGFRVRIFDPPGTEGQATGPRTRFIVSDGIAWVSVFVETADTEPRVSAHGPAARPDGVVVMGSSAAYVSRINGYRVTVVGEVPPMTVKSIAEAVQPE
jgi:sigma-E factor negative regulatory protein RseB